MIDRLRYEMRLLGWKCFLTPVLVMVGFALLAVLLHFLSVEVNRPLQAGLEMFLSIAMGVIISTFSTQDACLELQLTMPRTYQSTAFLRIRLLIIWAAIVGFVVFSVIFALGLTYQPQVIHTWPLWGRFLVGQFSWLAPLLWFIALGLVATLLLQNKMASTALLGGIWLIEAFFLSTIVNTTGWLQPVFLFATTLSPSAQFWLTNRIEITITALILLPIGWKLLENAEVLLKGSSEE